jgi:hypothetical protein
MPNPSKERITAFIPTINLKDIPMNTFQQAFKLLALATFGLGFAAASTAAPLSSATYDMARTELKDSYRSELDACKSQSGNVKDICQETAKGREKVAMAHLQYQRTGDAKDMGKLNEARYEARYAVDKERCDDQTGNAKSLCTTQVKAARDKAKANVKMTSEVTEATGDAISTTLKADYKVAQERCDALSGNAKDACVASAKARFGQ